MLVSSVKVGVDKEQALISISSINTFDSYEYMYMYEFSSPADVNHETSVHSLLISALFESIGSKYSLHILYPT